MRSFLNTLMKHRVGHMNKICFFAVNMFIFKPSSRSPKINIICQLWKLTIKIKREFLRYTTKNVLGQMTHSTA